MHITRTLGRGISAVAVIAGLLTGGVAAPALAAGQPAETAGTTRPASAATAAIGTLTGIVRLSPGTAVALAGPATAGAFAAPARICVTARLIRQLPAPAAPGTSQRAAASQAVPGGRTSASAVTSAQGEYTISGLRAGSYALRYQDCPAGAGLTGHLAGLAGPASAATVLINGGRTAVVPPATLRPASMPALLTSRPASWLAAAARQQQVAGPLEHSRNGRISGRVTAKSGRPLAGVCVLTAKNSGGFSRTHTGQSGRYLTKPLRAGRYLVAFEPGCGNNGNWLLQLYKNTTRLSKATHVRVRAGHTTKGISAVMHPGGEIRGTVTSKAGKKLSAICVFAVQHDGIGFADARTSHGHYVMRGLTPGRYAVTFGVSCGNRGNFAPQQWKDKTIGQRPTLVHVRAGRVTSGINAVMHPGAVVSGKVTLGTSSGTPLAGICAELDGAGSLGGVASLTSTGSQGTYRLNSLPAGQYRVSFFPGCGKNPNVLSETLPGRITLTGGKVTRGVDGVLQRGGVISGTVTSDSGQPLAGVCVSASAGNAGGFVKTSADGTYHIGQLTTGRYHVEFTGGCGNDVSLRPLFLASPVSVTTGQATSGIDAVMEPGGTISGHVTDSARHALSNICVEAVSTSEVNEPGNFETITRNGSYELKNEPPGQYQVSFFDCGRGNLADQSFPGRPGSGVGELIFVGPAIPTRGINAVMRQGGRISGLVTSRSGRALANICVFVTGLSNGGQTAGAFTSRGGRYTASGLAAGRYQVEFTACLGGNVASSWYRNKPGPSVATPVRVRAGRTTTRINGALGTGGSISGRVTAQGSGTPLSRICAIAFTRDDVFFGAAVTRKDGTYTIPGLNTGSYEVDFSQCLANRPTVAGQARVVHVITGKPTAGINVSLGQGGSITGSVLAGQPAVGAPGLCVDVVPVSPRGIGAFPVTAGAGGRFTAVNVLPGTYKVLFDDPECGGGLIPQWFSDKPSEAAADTVTVTAGATTSLPAATLAADGGISGTVTGPSGQPLTGACVSAIPTPATAATGQAPVLAPSHGRYSVEGLLPGRYRVRFSAGCGAAGLATQWWQNAASQAAATLVTVRANIITQGVDAMLKRAH